MKSETRTLLCVLSIVFIIITATIIALGLGILLRDTNISTTTTESVTICQTPECYQATKMILDSIDPTVDPCEDFFKFTCGNYRNISGIPRDRSYIERINENANQSTHELIQLLEESSGESETPYHNLMRIYYTKCKKDKSPEDCVDDMRETLLGIPLTALHAKKYFDDETITLVEKMFRNIAQVSVDHLKKVTWIDDRTLETLVDKVSSIQANIGYPKEVMNATFMSKLVKMTNLPNNPESLDIKKLRDILSKFNMREGWDFRDDYMQFMKMATKPDASYYEMINQIYISIGFLRGVYFHLKRPNYLNYGTTGNILGHEIFHSIDAESIEYDKNHIKFSWPDTSLLNHRQKEKCLADQYKNIFLKDGLTEVNSNRTLNDDIADVSGHKYAYLAYQKLIKEFGPEPTLPGLNYTANQLFFIATGQGYCETFRNWESYVEVYNKAYTDHSPNRHRVNGIVKNSPFFAEIFNCPSGSPMNPVDKCEVW